MQFLYDNLLDSATLTASSSATGFPANNLKNPFRTKVWRTAGATAGTANLVINHGSAKAVTCIALTGYTWTSAPGTLNLEFNATDSWGAPSATETLTWAATPTTNGNKATIIKIFASKSYQYNRLNVVYSPGAVPTDWDLGRIFVGTYFQPTYNYDPQPKIDMGDESIGSKTIGGQKHFDEIEKFRPVSFSCTVISQAQWELFQTMINTVGISKSLFVAFDYDNEPDEMTIYGHFTNLPGASGYAYAAYNLSFGFEEDR